MIGLFVISCLTIIGIGAFFACLILKDFPKGPYK